MEEINFHKEVPVLFKKYKVKRKIGQGAFGAVYSGQSISNNKLVAIKVEKQNAKRPSLETEAFFLSTIKGVGIPEIISFGKVKTYNALVEPLLGENLFDIFIQKNKRFAIEEVCLIAIQVLERIQLIHSRYVIHRDIKPDNFLIGKDDPNVIYLIDFGLSKKYRSSTTKKHVHFRNTGKLTGTLRYASPNALRGNEQSRKDDLISIGYMIIYFLRKKLPWQYINEEDENIRYARIYRMKKEIKPEELCCYLPNEIADYMRYVQKLGFEQNPDYIYLRGLFISILKKLNKNYDKLLFSWINSADVPKLKKPVNPSSRRSSSRERLWKKINENLKEKQRGTSSESSENKSYEIVQNVKINSPNMKMIRNNSKDVLDASNQKSIINSNVRTNINTLMVNFDKTINNQLMVTFDNIDNQLESKNPNNQKKVLEEKNDKVVDLGEILMNMQKNKKCQNKENINQKKDSPTKQQNNIIMIERKKEQSKPFENDNKNNEKNLFNLFDNNKKEINLINDIDNLAKDDINNKKNKDLKENNLNDNNISEQKVEQNILFNEGIKSIINIHNQIENKNLKENGNKNNIVHFQENVLSKQNKNLFYNNGNNLKVNNINKNNKNTKDIIVNKNNLGNINNNKFKMTNKNNNMLNLTNANNNVNNNQNYIGFKKLNNNNNIINNDLYNNNYNYINYNYVNYTEPSNTYENIMHRNQTAQNNYKHNNIFLEFNKLNNNLIDNYNFEKNSKNNFTKNEQNNININLYSNKNLIKQNQMRVEKDLDTKMKQYNNMGQFNTIGQMNDNKYNMDISGNVIKKNILNNDLNNNINNHKNAIKKQKYININTDYNNYLNYNYQVNNNTFNNINKDNIQNNNLIVGQYSNFHNRNQNYRINNQIQNINLFKTDTLF